MQKYRPKNYHKKNYRPDKKGKVKAYLFLEYVVQYIKRVEPQAKEVKN